MIAFEDFEKIPAGVVRAVLTQYETAEYGKYGKLWFVVVKADSGPGRHDWAIYYHREHLGIQNAVTSGDKVTMEHTIQDIFPCDKKTFDWYRR